MKLSTRILLATILLGFGGLHALPAHADTKIAVVDMERVFRESKAGQAAQRQLMAQQKSIQDDLAKQQQTLQTTKDELQKQQNSGKTGDDFATKLADYQKKAIDLSELAKKKDTELRKSQAAAIDKLRSQVGQAIGDIAQRDKIDFVLNREAVLLGDKTMDLTDQVIASVDGGAKTASAATPAPAAVPVKK